MNATQDAAEIPVSRSTFERAVAAALVPAVRRSFLTSALSIVVFSSMLVWTAPTGVAVWLAVRVLVSAACLMALRELAAAPADPESSIGRLVVIMGVSGAVWGLLPALINPEGPEWQAVIVLWIFGNQSVVTTVCSADRRVFTSAIGSVTAIGALTMAMSGSGFAVLLAGLILLGGLYSQSVFGAMHQVATTAIEGRLRSDELAISLQERQSELRAANAALTALAHGDVMTGLPNRRGFIAALVDGDRCLRGPGWMGIVDLDGFKTINDTWGHLAGDEVLAEIARRWAIALEGGYIARTGGDEFAFVLGDDADVARLSRQVLAAADEPVLTKAGDLIDIGCSVGVSRFDQGEPLSDVMARSDAALYVAKDGGRGEIAIEGDIVADVEQVDAVSAPSV